MKVGVKISGLSSSLAADAVVRLTEEVRRRAELPPWELRHLRQRAAAQEDAGSDQSPRTWWR